MSAVAETNARPWGDDDLPAALCPAHAQVAFLLMREAYEMAEDYLNGEAGRNLESQFINLDTEAFAEPDGVLPWRRYPQGPGKITPEQCPECHDAHRAAVGQHP